MMTMRAILIAALLLPGYAIAGDDPMRSPPPLPPPAVKARASAAKPVAKPTPKPAVPAKPAPWLPTLPW